MKSHIHHTDEETIQRMYIESSPVFILSTGRTGTKLIAELLNRSENVNAFHEPVPTLQYFPNFARNNQNKKRELKGMVHASRMEMILDCFINGKIYIEANQCLTFFAPVLSTLFKSSRFVHLIRHPGDFVSSAIRKGWYLNDSIWESGRARPDNEAKWRIMGQVEKLSWLWNETNSFIDSLKEKLTANRFFTISFEDLTSSISNVNKLIRFSGSVEIDAREISQIQRKKTNPLRITGNEPSNIKKTENFPGYENWTRENKMILEKHCRVLAEKYKYKL